MLLVIMETLINLSINCCQDDRMSSAQAALSYIGMNLPKLVIFDNVSCTPSELGKKDLEEVSKYYIPVTGFSLLLQ